MPDVADEESAQEANCQTDGVEPDFACDWAAAKQEFEEPNNPGANDHAHRAGENRRCRSVRVSDEQSDQGAEHKAQASRARTHQPIQLRHVRSPARRLDKVGYPCASPGANLPESIHI